MKMKWTAFRLLNSFRLLATFFFGGGGAISRDIIFYLKTRFVHFVVFVLWQILSLLLLSINISQIRFKFRNYGRCYYMTSIICVWYLNCILLLWKIKNANANCDQGRLRPQLFNDSWFTISSSQSISWLFSLLISAQPRLLSSMFISDMVVWSKYDGTQKCRKHALNSALVGTLYVYILMNDNVLFSDNVLFMERY